MFVSYLHGQDANDDDDDDREVRVDDDEWITSSSAIAERERARAAGWVSYGQKWKTVNGRQYFTDIIGLSSTTMT